MTDPRGRSGISSVVSRKPSLTSSIWRGGFPGELELELARACEPERDYLLVFTKVGQLLTKVSGVDAVPSGTVIMKRCPLLATS